jgi:hypothetical protein
MERIIVRFFQDEEDHWVVCLDCGHTQHVRHNPPHNERPWVLSSTERENRLGSPMDCVQCDRLDPPE